MGYIKKIKTDKDTKKVVSVRVPEIVVNAFNSAGVEAKEFGYELKMPDVIEEALINALNELKDETGVDFLKLEKFKHEMNGLQDKLKIDSKKQLDFNKLSDEIKVQVFNIGNLGQSIDIDLIIKEKKQVIKDSWNEYMISKKEKKVKSELEVLKNQRDYAWGLVNKFEIESGMHDATDAGNNGWGHFYSEAATAAEEAQQAAFDRVMKKNEKAIQKIKDANDKRERASWKESLSKKYPEKTDAEIDKIIDTPAMMNEEARLEILDL